MKRLAREFLGEFGEYWQRDAKKKLEGYKQDYDTGKMFLDERGSMRWKESNNLVPEDILELMYCGLLINDKIIYNTNRDRENDLLKLRKTIKKKGRPEGLEAAFDKGTKVINILTGEEFIV